MSSREDETEDKIPDFSDVKSSPIEMESEVEKSQEKEEEEEEEDCIENPIIHEKQD